MAAARVLELRHGDQPPVDRVHRHLVAAGYAVERLRPYAGDAVPHLDETVAGVVVHGGPFAVYAEDEFPFLVDEHRLIREALDAGTPLLGICQGAQSMARVLGAEVGPPDHGLHEFGYYEVRPTAAGLADGFLPGPLVVAQAHYHEFGIPDGAVRLAESDAYPNQAFRWGESAWGLQFHAEVTPALFRCWQDASWASEDAPGTQSRAEQDRLMALHDDAQAAWYAGFLARVFAPPPAAP
ncbi:MAG: glutamine amidotransferase [Actinobacteria bacterium]|nr:glutamine amidotransferase [Actinomycetota bacterium]